jgi:L-seryl-tRNA(Ser) seleniumtransferase
VQVETAADVEKAINEKTAMMLFLNIEADKGKIMHEEWVALGKKHNIPTSIDLLLMFRLYQICGSSMKWVFIGLLSPGGKALRGPQSAGLLMGKKDIIAAARLSMPPAGVNDWSRA